MRPTHAFAVPLHDLDTSGRSFAWPLSASWIDAVLADTEGEVRGRGQEGALDVRVSKVGPDVIVSGRVRAALAVSCARCLAEVPLDVDAELCRPSACERGHGFASADRGRRGA